MTPHFLLNNEALAHLLIQWEQFGAQVSHYTGSRNVSDLHQLTENLQRVRNTLVVIEKPALEYVVRELLALLEHNRSVSPVSSDDLADVLSVAERQIGIRLRLMQENVSADNVLAMVPLINDCRACREDMLLSDTVMLAAGVQLPEIKRIADADESWSEQRKVWITHAQSHHADLVSLLLQWRQACEPVSAQLASQMERLALVTARHVHLQTLMPLFQSAAVVADALHLRDFDNGPALQELFAQLEQMLERCTSVVSPEELLPGDLLRNFLYYVAQTKVMSDTAVELLRRFRLDRVRLVAQATQIYNTPTIGVVYHLTTAIRSGVIHETEDLRSWLDSHAEEQFPTLKSAKLRVRLGQLEPVLTVLGDVQSLQCLQSVRSLVQLLREPLAGQGSLRTDLSRALLELDCVLDQSARQSVLCNKAPDALVMSGDDDVYIDMAIDACLREARCDLQQCANSLCAMLQSCIFDPTVGRDIVNLLSRTDNALQILPLPEVSPLLQSLVESMEKFFSHSAFSAGQQLHASDAQSAQDFAMALFASLDKFLGCVFEPLPDISRFLTDAGEYLDQLRSVIESFRPALWTGPTESQLDDTHTDIWFDDFSLNDIDGLTLSVDDELLLESIASDQQAVVKNVQSLVGNNECLRHLNDLDESVRQALLPNAGRSEAMPNVQMLRALHALSGCAQDINATAVVSIVQPVQRVSLALHRENRHFDIEMTRTISDLLVGLRARLKLLSEGRPIEDNIVSTEKILAIFLSQANSAVRQPTAGTLPAPAVMSNVSALSLNDVFVDEASDILDQLHDIVRRKPFDSTSEKKAFALLHTLKGSARIAGKESICNCTHTLERDIQLLDKAEERPYELLDGRLEVYRQGCRVLQSYLLQISVGTVSTDLSSDADLSGELIEKVGKSRVDDNDETHLLLALASDLAFSQIRMSDELARLSDVCEDIQIGTMHWCELRNNGDISDSPVLNEMIGDMEASHRVMLDALQAAQQQHMNSASVSSSLQNALVRSQLVRVDQVRDRLIQTINDTATHCGVAAQLQLTGGEMMIERRIFQRLIAPLEHLARNAVVHGIESAEARKLSGKADVGLIMLEISMDGTELVLCFSDDGSGLSPKVIDSLHSASDKPDSHSGMEIQRLLFSAGFSSLEHADVVAGHGLGLSAVQTLVEQMDGQVQLDDIETPGFSITLRIPQKLVVNQVILVQSDDCLYGIPVVHASAGQWEGADPAIQSRQSDGSLMPVLALHELLGHPESLGSKHAALQRPIVSVEVAGRTHLVEVDKVLGYRELLIQNLVSQSQSASQSRIGSVLGSGQQALILDLSKLLTGFQAGQLTVLQADRDNDRPIALVVDNSPARRQWTQLALTNRGIDVCPCVDGNEALEHLARQRPDIIIIDLEMPQMDGVAFVGRIKAELGDSVPPFILVGSRDDEPTWETAQSLGAVMCLSRPFSETRLQEAVQAAGLRLPDLAIA